ncbi:MAG: hypothetical protein IKI29_00155 [Clostridia bacterium]|nr:hypothetical protein [Clostridia bacterium]
MRFKLFGTQIYISFFFSAVIALALAVDRSGLLLPTFGAVVLHEAGHLLALNFTGCAPTAIRLIPASVQIVRPFCKKPTDETLIAVCGPLSNFLFSILFVVLWRGTDSFALLRFSFINLIIGIFNLLPVAGLDGGIILLCFLERHFTPLKAVFFLRVLSFVFSAAALTVGMLYLFKGQANPSFFLLALYFSLTALLKM